MDNDVREFLRQSNLIENERGLGALHGAIEAWEYAEGQTELSHGLIREVHFLLTRQISPYIAGRYREITMRIAGRECPHPSHIHPLMSDWIIKANNTLFDALEPWARWERIRRMHVEFEVIHPFTDGNGRVGRILMNWQRKLANLPILIIHEGDEQQEYYKWFPAG